MSSSLDQLKNATVVVIDTGEFSLIKEFQPQDATTNPSLIYKAVVKEEYAALLDEAIAYAKKARPDASVAELTELVMDKLYCDFGAKILEHVQGRVSTEIDARLSFDTDATIRRCLGLAKLYDELGVDWRNRVLFKIASTWEGIQAARVLEQFGYKCNLTLLFSFAQAVACADANVTLISPFVGRITDFYKKETGKNWDSDASEDPGVLSVRSIYDYYKKFGYKTIVMGASFRNVNQLKELAGCDYLTISPALLKELSEMKDDVPTKLNEEAAKKSDVEKVAMDEKAFRWMMSQDACATTKLAEGIRGFSADIVSLENMVREKLSN